MGKPRFRVQMIQTCPPFGAQVWQELWSLKQVGITPRLTKFAQVDIDGLAVEQRKLVVRPQAQGLTFAKAFFEAAFTLTQSAGDGDPATAIGVVWQAVR